MNIQQLTNPQLELMQAFIYRYHWCRQLMLLQKEHEKKVKVFEKQLAKEYGWMVSRSLEENSLLEKIGLPEIREEIEGFIARWHYRLPDDIIVDQDRALIALKEFQSTIVRLKRFEENTASQDQ